MAQQTKLNQLLGNLKEEEAKGSATLRPPVDHSLSLSIEEKYLLHLSKVLTGPDTCTAIYKTSQDGYIVSNNTGNPGYFQQVKEILDKYTSDNNREHAEARLTAILRQSPAYAAGESRDKKASAQRLLPAAASASSAPISENIRQDVGIILDGLGIACEKDIMSKMKFVNDPPGHMHAEMRLAPIVVDDIRSRAPPNPIMITSKLMCNPCDTTTEIINGSLPEDRQYRIIGSHRKTYPGWIAPNVPGVENLENEVTKALEAQYVELQEVKKKSALGKTVQLDDDWQQVTTSEQRVSHKKQTLAEAGVTSLRYDEPALLRNPGEFAEFIRRSRELHIAQMRIDQLEKQEASLKETLSQCKKIGVNLEQMELRQVEIERQLALHSHDLVDRLPQELKALESERNSKAEAAKGKTVGRLANEFTEFEKTYSLRRDKLETDITTATKLKETLTTEKTRVDANIEAVRIESSSLGSQAKLKEQHTATISDKKENQSMRARLAEEVGALRTRLEEVNTYKRPLPIKPKTENVQKQLSS